MRIFILLATLLPAASNANVPWSTAAHDDLIEAAFSGERADCISQIKGGSAWVDGFANQIPSRSYLHAMRTADQSVFAAKDLMANYIQSEYEIAAQLWESSTGVVLATPDDPLAQFTSEGRLITNITAYLGYCNHRGRALHPVMDSTSPAHAGFAVWSITDLQGIFRHGDFSGSIENEQALLDNPDLKKKTVGLMQIVQKLYIDLGLKGFRLQ